MRDPEMMARLGSVPLYADLDEVERSDLAIGLRHLMFRTGEVLIHQGASPDAIYFILCGRVRVTTRLPGGGEVLVVELGASSTIGELALIRSIRRTATVTAMEPVEVICADWRYLSAALRQLRPAAFKVFRNLARLLAERMRILHQTIREAVARDDRPYPSWQLPAKWLPAGEASEHFDVAAFLPLLPGFSEFDPAGIDAVRERARVIKPTRGHVLGTLDQDSRCAYVVVRGAVVSGFLDAGHIDLVSARGPGCFCATSPLIENRPLSVDYVVYERSVLLEIGRDQFLELFLGVDQTAFALLTAVIGHQAAMIARATNHLKRLFGLARLFQQLQISSKHGLTALPS
jgi:CRP-like cAMP-binding protein